MDSKERRRKEEESERAEIRVFMASFFLMQRWSNGKLDDARERKNR